MSEHLNSRKKKLYGSYSQLIHNNLTSNKRNTQSENPLVPAYLAPQRDIYFFLFWTRLRVYFK